MEPVSPALAGRFFITEAPGKPLPRILKGSWPRVVVEGEKWAYLNIL